MNIIEANQIGDKNSIKKYSKDGFILIKNVYKKTIIKNLKKKILRDSKYNKFNNYYEIIKGKKIIRRIEKIYDQLGRSKQLLNSKKIKDILKIYEGTRMSLFKDKLNFKYPGGEGFLPHVDGHFYWIDNQKKIKKGWQEYADNFCSIVIPLEKMSKHNGCLQLAKKNDLNKIGTNFNKILKKITFKTPNIKKKFLKHFNFFPIEMEIGDICIFNWKCAHFSKKNKSKNSRMIFYITYSGKNKFTNLRQKYYKDKELSSNENKLKSLQI